MFTSNENVLHLPYPDGLKAILNIASAAQSREWLSHWQSINMAGTRLWNLPGLAQQLGVAQISLKDESTRSPLGSFKALGAPIALVRLIMRRWPEHRLTAKDLFEGRHRDLLGHFTVISATDGNHGKALAAAAQAVGCECVIVIHANVNEERERAIARFGARIIRTSGNYDESVEEAARLATKNGWNVVSDTSYEGYEDIPRDVMQGYSAIAAEVIEQSDSTVDECAFTHVFVQGGVGGLAAGIVGYLWEFHQLNRPRFIVVEPNQADCLYQSAAAGRVTKAAGSVDSLMAGLACGEASPIAWKILQAGADYFMTVSDTAATEAMRVAATGNACDAPLLVGESGAAGLAGLIALLQQPAWKAEAGLNAESRVLLISTEGATAPSVYKECVGETAESVLSRQAAWLKRGG
ncbi:MULTISPECIES: diaminopropionate ammonia-lyase [Paraburkholderia]|uniref:diaminopropionate ammonia-lyase n=1 Tax=Paraburkholderia TaxID=1822464 RepID=UPI0038B9B2D8